MSTTARQSARAAESRLEFAAANASFIAAAGLLDRIATGADVWGCCEAFWRTTEDLSAFIQCVTCQPALVTSTLSVPELMSLASLVARLSVGDRACAQALAYAGDELRHIQADLESWYPQPPDVADFDAAYLGITPPL